MNSVAEAPQDSVLRRHWQSTHTSQAVQEMQDQATPSGPQTNDSVEVAPRGIFAWVKSLFS